VAGSIVSSCAPSVKAVALAVTVTFPARVPSKWKVALDVPGRTVAEEVSLPGAQEASEWSAKSAPGAGRRASVARVSTAERFPNRSRVSTVAAVQAPAAAVCAGSVKTR
jgi:hypothetical protein